MKSEFRILVAHNTDLPPLPFFLYNNIVYRNFVLFSSEPNNEIKLNCLHCIGFVSSQICNCIILPLPKFFNKIKNCLYFFYTLQKVLFGALGMFLFFPQSLLNFLHKGCLQIFYHFSFGTCVFFFHDLLTHFSRIYALIIY